MSFILDALKKSETDRQQQGSAEFAGVPTSPATSSVPRWLWVVGILLAINLAVLIGLLYQPDTATTPAAVPARAEANSMSAAEIASPSSFEEQVAAAQRNAPEQQTADSIDEPEVATSTFVKPVLISQNPSAVSAADLYPSFQEVRASGSSNLPELHLDIHVYSPKPEDRFVFINMVKLREGSELTEGPQVSEITPEGVVLEHQGQLFLLPRDQ
jgi:general secretion pathway protein B